MNYWTKRRWASLAVHVAFVSVPFTLSTASALLFWQAMFQSWYIAVPMVAVIEVLALIGLVLFILRIESPFIHLRHLLPFISIIPLGREMYLLLAHNEPWIAWSLTALATSVLVVISWQCFRTIERLFIDPIQAAREKAREQVRAFTKQLAQLEEMNVIVDGFVRERLDYHAPALTAARVADQVPAFPAPMPAYETAAQAQLETKTARLFFCPNCSSELTQGAYGAAKRHGHCSNCKEAS